MLVALDKIGRQKIAFLTEKDEEPFYCPSCNGELTLKKGNIKEHHFSHKTSTVCQHGVGESYIHYMVKRQLYNSLLECSGCSSCDIEYDLHGVRPDVCFTVSGTSVAIEVQKSNISIDEISRRTAVYAQKGYYVIWIQPEDGPKSQYDEFYQEITRMKEWQKYIQALYYGRLYYYAQEGLGIIPIRMDEYSKEIEPGDFEQGCYDGYTRYYKSIKLVLRSPRKVLHLINDFWPKKRLQPFKTKKWTIPSCNIWIDKHAKWW